MARDPAERWPSAAAMAAAVEAAYAEVVGDRLLGPSGRASSSVRRRAGTEEDEPLSELRLRRSDVNAYERSLRRQRLGVTLGGLLLIAGLAAIVVWWTVLREAPPHRHEVEPNDTVGDATRIAAGTRVTGYLGKRRSKTDPDADVFALTLPDRAPLVTVRLAAVPNLDLTLTVRDGGGRVIAMADEQAVGGGEVLHRRRGADKLTVEVGQVMSGAWPMENVSDPYTLEVVVEPPDPAWEAEPNGESSDATPIAAGATMRGFLDARADVDSLRWDGPDGDVLIDVVAPGGVAVSWSGPDGAPRSGGATVKLRRGDVIRLRRGDREQPKGTLAGIEAAWAVTLTSAR
jgi:hypothetical protein